jgi:NitT/TauT family transport system ATP-binding protein
MYKAEGISKSFGELKVFQELTLEFPAGKITAILGPSGCGKTTILKIMAGLSRSDEGTVISTKRVSFLFQEPRLLPWLSIYQNLELVLEDKLPARERDYAIKNSLQAVGLGEYHKYYPRQLSGGMKQRAAMARALSYPAELLLMDEPFKSLDLKTRFHLISDFLRLWLEKPNTAAVVTHDVKEAVWLGDRVLVLSARPARLVECFQNDIPLEARMDGEASFRLEQAITKAVLKS